MKRIEIAKECERFQKLFKSNLTEECRRWTLFIPSPLSLLLSPSYSPLLTSLDQDGVTTREILEKIQVEWGLMAIINKLYHIELTSDIGEVLKWMERVEEDRWEREEEGRHISFNDFCGDGLSSELEKKISLISLRLSLITKWQWWRRKTNQEKRETHLTLVVRWKNSRHTKIIYVFSNPNQWQHVWRFEFLKKTC